MAEFDVDQLAAAVANEARRVIQEAEARAREIVAAAERQAEEIRGRAEAEARERVEGARRALEELTARFGSAGGSAPPSAPQPPPATPASAPAPEEPVESAANEPAVPAAPPASAPAPVAQGEPGPAPSGDDTQAARLVAMKMALDGASREEIDAELERSYSLADRATLVDEVLAKARR